MDGRIVVVILVAIISCASGQVFQYFIVNNNDQTAKVIDTVKLPTCTHLDQKDNVTLRGGIKSGKFTKHGIVDSINNCINTCCQDEKCDVAFMPGNICYTVDCYSEKLCESIPATPSNMAEGAVQISHIIRGGGAGDDVDEFRKKNGVNRNSLPDGDKCVFSRVGYNQTIAGGKQAGEVIDLGTFVDVYDCADKCCQHENCDVAHVRDGKCFAVDCYTKDLCRSIPARSDAVNGPNVIVYMNQRNGKRQKHKDKCITCNNGLCTGSDQCACDVGFTGDDCTEEETDGHCDPVCGPHGSCLTNDTCSCHEGWHGYKCHKKVKCIPACMNGMCLNSKMNTCKCDIGWTGPQCNESTTDKLILASSGEEVLFTDSELEPELDIKIPESPRLHESESISTLVVAIGCGVAAALLGTAAVIYIGKQILGKGSVVNYEYVSDGEEKEHFNKRHLRRGHP